MKKFLRCTLVTSLLLQSGCGYLLYPERINQEDRSGKVDPTILLLDAAGLLVGVLPGVVAFAVDIATGTIFLLPDETSAIEKHTKKLKQDAALNRLEANDLNHLIDMPSLERELHFKTKLDIPIEEIVFYIQPNSEKKTELTLAHFNRLSAEG